jgi:hypothetical protein
MLAGMHQRKRPLGRPRFTWKDKIKMDFKGTRWTGISGSLW